MMMSPLVCAHRSLAAYLASDPGQGQLFGVRGKEIMLFGHMRPIMHAHHAKAGPSKKGGPPKTSR
jgi:hypothetical protein